MEPSLFFQIELSVNNIKAEDYNGGIKEAA
jgi:hypothetical protein